MVLSTKEFGHALKCHGFDFYSGVPCSFLKDLINYAINDCEYIMAANEGDAVAICAGASLGGRKTVFLCQNSGLTNATSPLTSLNYTFQIPLLGFVSLRGEAGLNDEPQHELMGQITCSMLDIMKIKWEILSADAQEAASQLKRANEVIESGESFFFVVKKGTFTKEALLNQPLRPAVIPSKHVKTGKDTLPRRWEVLQALHACKDQNTVFLATTGFTGRELCEAEDSEHNLYMVGSMGCVSSLALGLARTRMDKDIIAIDGDGSVLMRMGALATAGYYGTENMFHLLLDNHVHASTGGQSTVSGNINFVELAASLGYQRSIYLHNIEELEQAISTWRTQKGLTFAYMNINQGTKDNLGRPKLKPTEVKERLMQFLHPSRVTVE